jgi:hypothetical protein
MTTRRTNPTPPNLIDDPDHWKTGGEPMTDAQASYLHTLAVQAHHPEEADDHLTKAEASKRIDELRHDVGLDRKGQRKSLR